ncbi:MAG: class I SAM-dependent methyltransferase [Candidatus Hodarchaeota archaeon]
MKCLIVFILLVPHVRETKDQLRNNRSIDYDSISEIYDQVRVGDPEIVFHLLEGIHLNSDSWVLDVGCGTGNNTFLFQHTTNAQIIGLDLSAGMLSEAREKITSVEFVQAPADALPHPSNSFDMVFMTEVIHHLPTPLSAISEVYRVLSSEGLACIVTQSHKQIEQRMTSRFFPATVTIDQARYPDTPEIEDIMSQAGFQKTWCFEYRLAAELLGEEYLKTVSRKGYSMLHKISEEEFQRGLQKLREALEQGEKLDYSAGYSFVWGLK